MVLIDTRSGGNGRGSAHPGPPPRPSREQTNGKKPRSRLIDDVAIERIPKPEYLIDGLIPEGSFSVLYGPPASAKTFLVLDWALSIGSGRAWHRRDVRKGPVVFVSAEGSAGLGVRIAAWKQSARHEGLAGVFFLREPVNLLDDQDVSRFISEDINSLGRPSLVVFDTLARCMVGAEENSARDMGRAIASADRIRSETGSAVLVIHHTRKNGSRERGSGALTGAANTVIAVKSKGGAVQVTCDKQKDDGDFDDLKLRLFEVDDSCVLLPATQRIQEDTIDLTKGDFDALRTLTDLDSDGGATLTSWVNSSDMSARHMYRVKKKLVGAGLVAVEGEGRGALHRVTAEGRDLLPDNLTSP